MGGNGRVFFIKLYFLKKLCLLYFCSDINKGAKEI